MSATEILYVDEEGAHLRKEQGRIIIEKGGETVEEVLIEHLEQIVLAEGVDVTGTALMSLLDAGVDVCFLNYYGFYKGRVTSDLPKNCGLRLAQYAGFSSEEKRLDMSRAFIRGKMENARTLLQRISRKEPSLDLSAEIGSLAELSKRLAEANPLNALRGIEGSAARVYFEGFAKLLRPPWTFRGRVSHPAPDPVNALLGLAYGLLRKRVETAVSIVGLDPTIGFLHEPHPGRFSLALDLMEEFRPVLSDSAALMFLHRNQAKTEDFESTAGGMRLKEAIREEFYAMFESRMATETIHPVTGVRASYRKHIETQARRFAKALQGAGEYQPFIVR